MCWACWTKLAHSTYDVVSIAVTHTGSNVQTDISAVPAGTRHGCRRDAIKRLVYTQLGFLFRRSVNYRLWLEQQNEPRILNDAPASVEPTPSQWAELCDRRAATPGPSPSNALPGNPYIVVPVYAGRVETLAGLYSVLAADPHASLLVIDDASPERVLCDRLVELAEQGHFELLRNGKNLGFSRTVNRGIAARPDRDVVLLNSDTEVYGDWIRRIHAAAYSEERVGTVTPLSNNAEICSYPYWLRDNAMALEVDYPTLDAMAADVNRGLTETTPTGVGFCMYIRRGCLDEIGPLDDQFAAGYGEENDFCLRAGEAGWLNLIAGDVFVRHVGEVSFQKASRRKRARALELLHRRYPSYDEDIQRYIARRPGRMLRLNLDVARLKRAAPNRNPTRSVLFVNHGWGGGVEHHVRDMQHWLEEEGVNVYYLRPHTVPTNPAVSLSLSGLKLTPNIDAIDTNPEREIFGEVLKQLGIDHIHIHHLAGFGDVGVEWIRSVAASVGCSYDVTLHDYGPVCPRLHMSLPDGSFCDGPEIAVCETCVVSHGSPFGYQPVWRWRNRWKPLLEGARRVFCPSEDVARRTESYYPGPRYLVRPHQERVQDLPQTSSRTEPMRRTASDRLRVAVPGAIGEQKGFELLVACAEDARRRNLPIDFTVVGYTMNDRKARAAGIDVSGAYDSGEGDKVLADSGCQIAFLPSLSPETFSFVLSSALRIGMYPLVFDLGALAERIREIQWGTVLPLDLTTRPESVNDALLALDIVPPPKGLATRLNSRRYPSIVKDYYEDFAR